MPTTPVATSRRWRKAMRSKARPTRKTRETRKAAESRRQKKPPTCGGPTRRRRLPRSFGRRPGSVTARSPVPVWGRARTAPPVGRADWKEMEVPVETTCRHCGVRFVAEPRAIAAGPGWRECPRCRSHRRASEPNTGTARSDADHNRPPHHDRSSLRSGSERTRRGPDSAPDFFEIICQLHRFVPARAQARAEKAPTGRRSLRVRATFGAVFERFGAEFGVIGIVPR